MKKTREKNHSDPEKRISIDFPDYQMSQSTVNIVIEKGDFDLFLSKMTEFVLDTIEKNRVRDEDAMRYTADEVCNMLSVTKNTLNRWDNTGYLKPIHIGRRILYKAREVNKILGVS